MSPGGRCRGLAFEIIHVLLLRWARFEIVVDSLDHALEDQHVGGARREGQQYRRSHCHLGDLFLDDFSLPRLTRLSWRSRPYWLDLTSQCFGDAGRRKYRWRVVAFE